MFTFGNDTITENETESVYEDIGVINSSKFGNNIPFYSILIRRQVYAQCKKENNCYEYINDNFEF